MGSAGIGNHAPFLGLVGPVDKVGVAALGAAGALAGQPAGAVGAAGDRPRTGAGLGRGRIHRAESFGELEGALSFGTVCEEAAGLPAQW
jgi:hypothetical protein